ncbi:MAG: sigma-54-dependent transcriptional regulator, partial [Spirochaetota bacterium]
MDTILLVDDEERVLVSQKELLELHGFRRIMLARGCTEARRILSTNEISMAIVDLTLHEESGMELLAWIKTECPDTVILVVTGASDISLAVQCMRSGAYDFLVKGADTGRLPSAVSNALAHRNTQLENRRLRNVLVRSDPDHPESFKEFVSRSSAIRRIFVYLEAVAKTPDPVLLTGETGVGKEVIARAIHIASGRRGDFVAVNLGGLDNQTLSDTLFGHTRGAFTGASGARDGLVRKAAGGTLFLDEFAEAAPETQVKLLRLIDVGEFMPIGSDKPLESKTRLVLATNRDVEVGIEEGWFRRDLFYRISNHWVNIPPLRERPEDLEPILIHLMQRQSHRLDREPIPVDADTVERIKKMPLNGNTRELEQLVVHAILHGRWDIRHQPHTDVFETDMSGRHRLNGETSIVFGSRLPTPAEAIEELLREADRRFPNNRTRAAGEIGL